MKTKVRTQLSCVAVGAAMSILSGCCVINPNLCSVVIDQHPQNQFVKVGNTATFTVVAHHGPPNTNAPLTYQWRLNGVDIPGATATSLTTGPQTFANVGDKYTVVVTGSPSEESEPAFVSVYTTTPNGGTMRTAVAQFTNHPTQQTICGANSWNKWYTYVTFYGSSVPQQTGPFQNTSGGNLLDINTCSTVNGASIDTCVRVRENSGGLLQIGCHNNSPPTCPGISNTKLSNCLNVQLNPEQTYRMSIYLKNIGSLPEVEFNWLYH